MSKQEFIDRLRAALNGRIPTAQLEDTINYYQDYINSELRSGKSETEVMGALGDPRLIARTIIETAQPAGNNSTVRSSDGNYQNGNYQNGAQNAYNSYQDTSNRTTKHFRIPGWLLTIIVILVVFLLISAVFSVLSFLAPVIIVIVAVLFLVKLFRDWLN